MKTHEGQSLLVKREVDDRLLIMKSVKYILTITMHILPRTVISKTPLLETEFIFFITHIFVNLLLLYNEILQAKGGFLEHQ